MTNYNITKHQRRDSLALYLVHCSSEHQRMYLKSLKSDELRVDLKERMREQLALEVAKMDTNMRNLRLARLKQRCKHTAFEQSFFQDILSRVKKHLAIQPAEEPVNE